jgi:hypothetical protein
MFLLIASNQFAPLLGAVRVMADGKALPTPPDNYKSLFVTDCYVAILGDLAT